MAVSAPDVSQSSPDDESDEPHWSAYLVRSAQRTARYLTPTAPFAARSGPRVRQAADAIPDPGLGPGAVASVALDEIAIAAFQMIRRMPARSEWDRITVEVESALKLYERRGWLTHPRSMHDDPGAPTHPRLRRAKRRSVQVLSFPSVWRPAEGEMNVERWTRVWENSTVRALVHRHDDRPRPWVVAIHGAEMGRAAIDGWILRSDRIFKELGCNVVLPVLPFHGPRRPKRYAAGPAFPSLDMVDNVRGLAQGLSDLRATMHWVRSQGATAIGVEGISLGGYMTSLLASYEDDIDCVIAGMPAVDFPAVFRRNVPEEFRQRPEYRLLDDPAARLHRVVSPLEVTPLVSRDRRYIFAGSADRLCDAVDQVARLRQHWDAPQTLWYPGGHMTGMMRRDVWHFMRSALTSHGVCDGRH
ncbi:MAG: alpha/beta hydrolase family protein [Acidimicrobiia bacterium]|nr:alpha/beta hydrolase family protein [Acidimicrobiia bacterium]